ncbi:MAG: M20/M25/M40 family metallo-hydrolase [Acidaminococcus sp.]|nr:M20/M25/M40 family metallo-hydrolase [Acidaminococcus sp.]MCI2099446.1 M20/M25/M40 family metallo-hydrolase [Acidaminococcus sp.]MCI2113806.1 M20/M25/M40 family metallo-hydrolase [Acidaminococcus sp.]MCI2115620.1 M20/M25/M40 family metallo-hydrolase [Acidaminococcus sp.]
MNQFDEIKAFVTNQKESMLALWKQIVNTESGPDQIDGVNRVGNILSNEMGKAGCTVHRVKVLNAGDMVIGEWNTDVKQPPVVLMGHIDTVFTPGAAQKNPFRIDDKGFAHGPGVADMKGGDVIALYVLKALQQTGYKKRPIRLVFVPDEETLHMRSDGKARIAEAVKDAAAVFNFEPAPAKGKVVVGRYGGGPVSIRVHGIAAHSGGAPEKGRSAILEAAHKILALEAANDIPRGKLINCGAVEGGIGENTIPAECLIRIGIRFRTAAIGKEIFTLLDRVTKEHTVPDTTAELDISHTIPCMDTTEAVKKLFACVQETARDGGMGELEGIQVGGLSDAGIPIQAGIPTLCGMGVVGTGAHTYEEAADVASLTEKCILAAASICRL